jgi:GR25 family glycosyltransferase involved in LPS biosynthesis
MLKNHNHDLVHSLSEKLDAVWRYQREYLKNAKGCSSCIKIWKKLMTDDEKHVKILKEEISRHIKRNRFN